jgi:excisionase family DNA binding protein
MLKSHSLCERRHVNAEAVAREPEPLLHVREIAAWLGVPVATLYAWRHKGEGPPALRVGRHLRYRRDDVEHWLEQQSDRDAAA